MYICLGMVSVMFMILTWFYLYFGINLANFYSSSFSKEIQSKERLFIHNKMLFISVVLGILFLTRGFLSLLTCLNVFKDIFPEFFEVNLWDNIVGFIVI